MAELTISLPDDLTDKMGELQKKYKIDWNEIAKDVIEEKLRDLEV